MNAAPRYRTPGQEEIVHPYPTSLRAAPQVRELKSTLLVSSLQSLREQGRYDAYLSHLPRELRETIPLAIAGVWLPLEVGMAHYRATNALGMTVAEQADMGSQVGKKIQATLLGTLAKLARSSGATPWTVLAQFQRLFERIFRGGGGTSIIKLGPKDARIEIAGLALASIPHFRNGFRTIILTGGELFTSRAYVRDIPGGCGETTLAYRASWA